MSSGTDTAVDVTIRTSFEVHSIDPVALDDVVLGRALSDRWPTMTWTTQSQDEGRFVSVTAEGSRALPPDELLIGIQAELETPVRVVSDGR
ncbi:hypothetical protein [Haloarchaeobius sp. HME9146]|uniref:hypothetical protein n=1 Tax=Haloarchaeobius sp. HME9146 TaxID=2978732 RepID=UPI0021C1363D|nr:hypothetical protein [Haloarchaeobius sp. HME9146]MCT9098138.1 hypothetical protein [Haloarchaeobius sp. HME9146]